ncbi:GntR family transcriptional regulator (plasmid) [Thioclava sp. 'Guangxiensis']|uniref:GntR family transcriptional regulator n=1 Tax=Thioclava sp. 'Guangxiensis' TaxID=3149044 RepID=UPI003877C907
MSRGQQTLKQAVNHMLDALLELETGARLGSESELAQRLQASRTTIRGVLTHLVEHGLIAWSGRDKTVLRHPVPMDYFSQSESIAPAELAESRFLEWILRTDLPPGSILREAELARRLDVPVMQIRELLIRYQPNGLFEKNSSKNWILRGFTETFANELIEMRALIEGAAFTRLLASRDPMIVEQMIEMERRHISLLARDDAAMVEFPALDAAFHRLICASAQNRFFDEFSSRIALIVHYHFQWNKLDETQRNRVALREHLRIIRAWLARDDGEAKAAFDEHLMTANRTLKASISTG